MLRVRGGAFCRNARQRNICSRSSFNISSSFYSSFLNFSSYFRRSVVWRKGASTIWRNKLPFLQLSCISGLGLWSLKTLLGPQLQSFLHRNSKAVYCDSQQPQIPLSTYTSSSKTPQNSSSIRTVSSDDDKDIDQEQQTPPDGRRILSLLWNHLRTDWPLLLSIVAITTASAAVNIVIPIHIGELVSSIQTILITPNTSPVGAAAASHGFSFWSLINGSLSSSLSLGALNGPALRLLTLFLIQGVLTFIDISLVSRLGENLNKKLKLQLYSSLLLQDIEFYDKRMQGELLGRLNQDVSEFKHTFKLVITKGLKCVTQVTAGICDCKSVELC